MSFPQDTQIGNWKLGKRLGHGSYGTVYIAKQLNPILKGKFVVKMIRNGRHDEDMEDPINEEIRILQAVSRLDSFPKFVEDFDFQEHTCLVVSKEYADLLTLFKKNPDRCFTPLTIQKIAFQLFKNLEALHNIGILHRDIKMENICLRDTSGHAKVVLIDFGVAKKYRDENGARIPPEEDKIYVMNKAIYSSRNVIQTNTHCEKDDLTQACFVCAELRGLYWLIHDNNNAVNIGKKIQLEVNPERVFADRDQFLVPLFEAVAEQLDFDEPDYEGILNVIKHIVPDFVEARNWDWKWSNGMFTLV